MGRAEGSPPRGRLIGSCCVCFGGACAQTTSETPRPTPHTMSSRSAEDTDEGDSPVHTHALTHTHTRIRKAFHILFDSKRDTCRRSMGDVCMVCVCVSLSKGSEMCVWCGVVCIASCMRVLSGVYLVQRIDTKPLPLTHTPHVHTHTHMPGDLHQVLCQWSDPMHALQHATSVHNTQMPAMRVRPVGRRCTQLSIRELPADLGHGEGR